MMRMRPILIRFRHGMLLAALLCVLLARTAVPAGWMPMTGADGRVVLAPCSGMGVMAVAKLTMPGMSGMAMAAHDGDQNQRHPDPAGDHPCSGAGVAVALDAPAPRLPSALAMRPVAVVPPALTVAIGRGLAAPPPPQTGPPILV